MILLKIPLIFISIIFGLDLDFIIALIVVCAFCLLGHLLAIIFLLLFAN